MDLNVLLYFWIAFLFVPIIMLILMIPNVTYCYIFDHKDWKKWDSLLQNVAGITYKRHDVYEDDPSLENYEFSAELDGEEVEILYWVYKDSVSVHGPYPSAACILSGFSKYQVKRMRKVLLKKIEGFEAGKKLITSVVRDYLLD